MFWLYFEWLSLEVSDVNDLNSLRIGRRSVLRASVQAAVVGAFFSSSAPSARAAAIGMPIDTSALVKFVDPLPIPTVIKPSTKLIPNLFMTQFTQKLHRDLAPTTVWGYNGSFPGPTIEVTSGVSARVRFTNSLPTAHLLPVDNTIEGAFNVMTNSLNPAVRTVTHLHGGHTRAQFDGHPDDWFIAGQSREYVYDNTQPAGTLWYHDHAMGITRLNVYAGLAGLYLVRDKAESQLNLPRGTFEVPLVIQDRAFNADGSLFYPSSRAYFDGYPGPYSDDPVTPSDVPPVWNPEFFGNAMLVNGKVWPFLSVFKTQYRFRVLNGCGSRFLILALSNGALIHQIGADGCFLPRVSPAAQLLLGPGERADVIIDFSAVPVGTKVQLLNFGPDAPFGGMGGLIGADPMTTGQIMEFQVAWDPKASTVKNRPLPAPPATTGSTGTPVARLVMPKLAALPAATVTRKVSLNEVGSVFSPDFNGPVAAMLGNFGIDPATGMEMPMPMPWMHPATETPMRGTCEVWEIHNFTMDAHPIHLHLVHFEILGRVMGAAGMTVADGMLMPPEPGETGRKDTVIAYPGDITLIRAFFDLPGAYVWHCHILEHEDQAMMRPLNVL